MLTSEIITSALDILQETLDEFITTAELYRWLNEGLIVFCDKTEVYQKEFTVTSVAGTANYTFDSLLLRPKKVWYDGSKLTAVDVSQMDAVYPGWRSADAGTPGVYFETTTRVLSLYPKPDTSGKSIIILGVSLPTVVSESQTTIDIATQYQPALIDYILYKAFQKDAQQMDLASQYLGLFVNKMTEASKEARKSNRSDRRYSQFPANIIK